LSKTHTLSFRRLVVSIKKVKKISKKITRGKREKILCSIRHAGENIGK
jgi:hypothetical protein